ncbi:MAG TPA: PilZ domain-containing protein [Vicinamibacterales bacterium]|nr:PilZ domain-containing protein [Vicinamibacterales bacterium]
MSGAGHTTPHERRREARVAPDGLRARVRPGHTLAIVDVSAGGALVEAACQLRPGSRVDVHLERDDGRRTVAAMVSRCSVSAIDAVEGVLYRAALCFTERCDWVRESLTREG